MKQRNQGARGSHAGNDDTEEKKKKKKKKKKSELHVRILSMNRRHSYHQSILCRKFYNEFAFENETRMHSFLSLSRLSLSYNL